LEDYSADKMATHLAMKKGNEMEQTKAILLDQLTELLMVGLKEHCLDNCLVEL